MTEKEIIEQIGLKNNSAFKKLVDRYQSVVFNTCYNLIGNKQDVEDVVQEIFIKIYKSAKDFRFEASVSTWIYRITINQSLNYLRIKKRLRWIESLTSLFEYNLENSTDFISPKNERPDVSFEIKERTRMIKKYINRLPDQQRIAFVLHKFEDLSYKEISEIMQKSISSVESLIHRAKLKLQENLVSFLKKTEK